MERAEIHELSAAYALDALEAERPRGFRRAPRAAAPSAGRTSPPSSGPPRSSRTTSTRPSRRAALRDRILDAGARASAPTSSRCRAGAGPLPVAAAAAVAAGIAAIGLGIWAADLSQQLDDVQAEQHRANEALIALIDPSASHFALDGADGVLVVDAESGEALARDQRARAALRPGRRTKLG